MTTPRTVIISVKVPIAFAKMTDSQRTRLDRITGRDTRVIRAYLGVIQRHENELLTGARRTRINPSRIDELTLTATRGSANRTSVQHDFKQRFPTISVNEFQECRDVATALWQSYLERRGSRPLQSSRHSPRKIPRVIFPKCFSLLSTPDQPVRHWLRIRDSLDSAKQNRRAHDHLLIPLSPSSYHLKRIQEGPVKTAKILKDRHGKWWAILTVTITVEPMQPVRKPLAVLAIDLGISRAACSVLLTQRGYRQVRYWMQSEKQERTRALDLRVASIQQKRSTVLLAGQNADGAGTLLTHLANRRAHISIEHDRKLAKDISNHVQEISLNYDLYVAIGRLAGIRKKAQRGDYRGPAFRGMIHRWSYARLHGLLAQKLQAAGFDCRKLVTVPESWTSIICHRCGHKGLRPRQGLFVCNTCGNRVNADLNGALNIGRRLITLIPSLRDENGLGMWLLPREKTTSKTPRSSDSEGKSLLPQRTPTSTQRESAADCHEQTRLKWAESSKDPAVANAVEKPSGVLGHGDQNQRNQRKETALQVRGNGSANLDKAHVNLQNYGAVRAGDCCHGKGGTQKLPAMGSLNNSL